MRQSFSVQCCSCHLSYVLVLFESFGKCRKHNCVRLFSNPVPASAIWDLHEKVELFAVDSIACVCASAVASACSGNAASLHLMGRTRKANENDKKKSVAGD